MDRIESSISRNRAQIRFYIDAFVEETAYVPEAARLVLDTNELSPRLERLTGTLAATSAWRAWAAGSRAWFVQGRLAESSDGLPDQPTVYLIFRDHDALPVTSGIWRRSGPARWELLQLFSNDLSESAGN